MTLTHLESVFEVTEKLIAKLATHTQKSVD